MAMLLQKWLERQRIFFAWFNKQAVQVFFTKWFYPAS